MLTGKDLMMGKIEGKRRGRWQRMRWLVSINDSVDINLSKFWKTVEDREVWCAAVHGVSRVRHDVTTEKQNQMYVTIDYLSFHLSMDFCFHMFSSVQSFSHVQLFAIP